MTQVLPAALVAPTQVSLSADAVGYLIRTIAGVEGSFVSNTGTAGAISKVASTGYFYATTGIIAPDDGGVLEWYISNAGVKSTFLSAVAIEPAPNQADQAAGLRAALGLASANMDTQLSAINSKTNALPDDPADQSELAQLIAAIPQGLTTQQNTRLTQLWQQAGFDSAVPVVRDKEGDVITETIGTTVITHTATNAGDTVTTERQP
jgi:hypothetical protein